MMKDRVFRKTRLKGHARVEHKHRKPYQSWHSQFLPPKQLQARQEKSGRSSGRVELFLQLSSYHQQPCPAIPSRFLPPLTRATRPNRLFLPEASPTGSFYGVIKKVLMASLSSDTYFLPHDATPGAPSIYFYYGTWSFFAWCWRVRVAQLLDPDFSLLGYWYNLSNGYFFFQTAGILHEVQESKANPIWISVWFTVSHFIVSYSD